ncbi:MAG TPA: D-sedoheptulose 7-phosphate isomerase [Flavobacteriales bacterium]|nr:D-sedoheptulose 7-phosphate isomerase [Flavobacteriales bacterium]
MSLENIKKHFSEAYTLLESFMNDENNFRAIEKGALCMVNAINSGNKIISCGNGGSMCDAMHFAEELSGRFRDHRASLPAISISDPSHITCAANDYGFDKIFSRFIEGLGQKGDVLLAISTSGNSKNILEAAKAAKAKGMLVVALTGKDGGELKNLANVEIRVPHAGYADRIQEIHIKIIHTLIHTIETKLNVS